MLRANQNTLSDSQRMALRSFTGSWPISLFDFSKPSATVSPSQLCLTATEFIEQTSLEVIDDQQTGVAPFKLWDGQRQALHTMEHTRLAVFLKARQLGISWVMCGFALWSALSTSNQTILAYSQGQLEANELIRRVSFLYHHHTADLPALTIDNIGMLGWMNGSRMLSLAATRKAGRSFTASIAILDEWAFMAWPRQTLAAVKPTIDAGGKLFIISSADGPGSAYHQFWQHAESGRNGYKAVFLPWFSHPERGPDWRDQKIIEASGDTASVLREYPANPIEAFTAAVGLVYDVWSDGPADGNVQESAEYEDGAGPVYWANDDGYAGKIDVGTGHFTPGSHPRVFLLVQEKSDGHLDVFAEDYRVKTELDPHLADVFCAPRTVAEVRSTYEIPPEYVGLDLFDKIRAARAKDPTLFYDAPEYIAADNAAATAIGIMHNRGFYTRKKPTSVEESNKNTRRMIAKDENGWRRIRVHPRCTHLRFEMASYRKNDKEDPVEEHDHGPSALRYLAWSKRLEE